MEWTQGVVRKYGGGDGKNSKMKTRILSETNPHLQPSFPCLPQRAFLDGRVNRQGALSLNSPSLFTYVIVLWMLPALQHLGRISQVQALSQSASTGGAETTKGACDTLFFLAGQRGKIEGWDITQCLSKCCLWINTQALGTFEKCRISAASPDLLISKSERGSISLCFNKSARWFLSDLLMSVNYEDSFTSSLSIRSS